jgi:uncharacterized spore protein YtfJ
MAGIEIIKEAIPNQDKAAELMGRLFETARPQTVFGDVVTQGEYAVITASEVNVGLGFGYGGGGGFGDGAEAAETATQSGGYGSGGGGGGGATARPVAVIEIGPHGVRVEPVFDPTKIVLAFFTAFGSMFMMLARMRKAAGA